MKEESHNSRIDPELETRIVALVLGESSDVQRDQLNRLIEERPELAALKEQLQGVHELMREVGTGESVAAADDWKLSAEKRDAVLAVMGGEANGDAATLSFSERAAERRFARKVSLGSLTRIAAVVCAAGCLAVLAMVTVFVRGATDAIRIASSKDSSRPSLAAGELFLGESSAPVSGFAIMEGAETDAAVQPDFETAMPSGAKGFDYENESRVALSAIRDSLAADPSVRNSQYRMEEDAQHFFVQPEIDLSNGSAATRDAGQRDYRGQQGDWFTERANREMPPQDKADSYAFVPRDAPKVTADTSTEALGVENSVQWRAEIQDADGAVSGEQRQSGLGTRLSQRDRMSDVVEELQEVDAETGPALDIPSVTLDSKQAGPEPAASQGLADLRGGTTLQYSIEPNASQNAEADFGAYAMDDDVNGVVDGQERDGEFAGQMGGGVRFGVGSGGGGFGGGGGIDAGSPAGADALGDALGDHVPAEQEPQGNSEEEFDVRLWDVEQKEAAQSQLSVAGTMRGSAKSEAAAPAAREFFDADMPSPAPSSAGKPIERVEDFREKNKAAEISSDHKDFDGDMIAMPRNFKKQMAADDFIQEGKSRSLQRRDGHVDSRPLRSDVAVKGKRTWMREEMPGLRDETAVKKSVAPAGLNETSAAEEAFSTFSLHVSDVSFKLAQAALARGQWPEAAKVRIEEFVNALDYGDPMPSQDEKVSCRLEQAIHPFLQQRNLLRVSMRTAAAGRASNTPLRLTFLLDNSGSMERSDRQQTVRRAFALLAGQLKPMDQVTLISFARQPRLLADRISGTQSNELVQLIDNLPSEGGTNIEAALQLAFEKAQEQQAADAQNRIILLTDGAVNLGDANPDSLSAMVTTMRDAGIAFDAAGISAEGLNDEVLEALTRKGDGRYYLLDAIEDAADGFASQIAGALRPSAKNVKVQIEFNPKRVGRYKLLGFEKHLLNQEDFRNDAVDAAEMAAAEAGVAVYQFEAKPDGEGDVGSVSVRFRDLSTGQMIENRWPIPYEADAARCDQAAPSLRIATAAALLAAKLRGEPLGETVDLKTLADLVSGLPQRDRNAKRVQQLQQMIGQARQLSGQ